MCVSRHMGGPRYMCVSRHMGHGLNKRLGELNHYVGKEVGLLLITWKVVGYVFCMNIDVLEHPMTINIVASILLYTLTI